jgi:hypothetical protein
MKILSVENNISIQFETKRNKNIQTNSKLFIGKEINNHDENNMTNATDLPSLMVFVGKLEEAEKAKRIHCTPQ